MPDRRSPHQVTSRQRFRVGLASQRPDKHHHCQSSTPFIKMLIAGRLQDPLLSRMCTTGGRIPSLGKISCGYCVYGLTTHHPLEIDHRDQSINPLRYPENLPVVHRSTSLRQRYYSLPFLPVWVRQALLCSRPRIHQTSPSNPAVNSKNTRFGIPGTRP